MYGIWSLSLSIPIFLINYQNLYYSSKLYICQFVVLFLKPELIEPTLSVFSVVLYMTRAGMEFQSFTLYRLKIFSSISSFACDFTIDHATMLNKISGYAMSVHLKNVYTCNISPLLLWPLRVGKLSVLAVLLCWPIPTFNLILCGNEFIRYSYHLKSVIHENNRSYGTNPLLKILGHRVVHQYFLFPSQ